LPQIDPIPLPSDINADWLTTLLGQPVTSVTATPIGTGQVGATYRFGFSSDDTGEPASLIGKFMSDDPVSRATGIAQMSYFREVKFYQNFGAAQSLPIPHAKFAEIDPATHQFALIMDDFPHHRSGNQLEPATLEEATLAMEAGAQIHAAFWDDSGLEQHAWLNGSHAASVMDVDALYTMLWPAFCARYGDRLNDQMRATGEAYVGRINAWIANRTGPRCLTHGDYRPDNMLFNEDDQSHPIVIVDWQTAGVGNGATDIAYYLGTALSPEIRRAHERNLVSDWMYELITAGVSPLDTTDLWHTYQRDAFAGFLMGVIASMIVAQTDRGDAMFLEMCTRSAAMVMDHLSMDLI
jgi:hypothetical protein